MDACGVSGTPWRPIGRRITSEAAQEGELLDPRAKGLRDDIQLDAEIDRGALVGLLPVGHDAPHLGGGDDHCLRPLSLDEKRLRGCLVGQVDVFDAAQDPTI